MLMHHHVVGGRSPFRGSDRISELCYQKKKKKRRGNEIDVMLVDNESIEVW